MTKTTQDMNNSIKFKVYSLKFKEMPRRGRGVRLMLLLAAMVGAQSVWTEYLFY